MSDDDKILVVIKLGSLQISTGISGDDAPRKVFLNLVPEGGSTTGIRNPVQDGVIRQPSDFALIVRGSVGADFDFASESTGVFVCDLPRHTTAHRKEMARVLFEEYQAPAVLFYYRPALSALFATRTTALVVEFSDDATYVVPVVDCVAQMDQLHVCRVGGRHLTARLVDLLRESSNCEGPFSQHDLRGLKARCRVAESAEEFHSIVNENPKNPGRSGETFVLLRDAKEMDSENLQQEITLPDNLSTVPEPLFQPKLIGLTEEPSIADAIHVTIAKADPALRNQLYGSIVLGGRGSMFPGLAARLESELRASAAAPNGAPAEVSIVAEDARSVGSWIGGSMLSSMRSVADNGFVTRDQWQTYGPAMFDSWSTN